MKVITKSEVITHIHTKNIEASGRHTRPKSLRLKKKKQQNFEYKIAQYP